MKNIIVGLLALFLCAPAAEAATAKSTGKTSATKASRTAKSVPRAIRAAKAAPKNMRTSRFVQVASTQGNDDPTHLDVKSTAAIVLDTDGRMLFAKNIDSVQPIASITKLMTAMVVLDARLDLQEPIAITEEDVDYLKHTRSRLKIGTILTREDLLRLALMASENRAASALGRSYPGGLPTFVAAMNRKALDIGMQRTRFVDSSGLSSDNVSSAQDLARMVTAAYRYPLIQEYTTLTDYAVRTNEGRMLAFRNSNGLVKDSTWRIDVSKTGYIQEAGRCLVMQARIAAKPVIIVLLDSWGKYTRIGDANRIKRWIENPLAHHTPG